MRRLKTGELNLKIKYARLRHEILYLYNSQDMTTVLPFHSLFFFICVSTCVFEQSKWEQFYFFNERQENVIVFKHAMTIKAFMY